MASQKYVELIMGFNILQKNLKGFEENKHLKTKDKFDQVRKLFSK